MNPSAQSDMSLCVAGLNELNRERCTTSPVDKEGMSAPYLHTPVVENKRKAFWKTKTLAWG